MTNQSIYFDNWYLDLGFDLDFGIDNDNFYHSTILTDLKGTV